MERFHLINQAENNEDFVGMDKFWMSISKIIPLMHKIDFHL